MAFPCKDGMTWRTTQAQGYFFIWNDLGLFYYVVDSDIAAGQPGFGARNLNTAAGNGFASISLGLYDTTPWTGINTASIATSVAANEVDFQWQNAVSAVGICGYQTYRDGTFMGGTTAGPTLVDHSVSPNSMYQYAISSVNCQGQQILSASFPVHTPSPGGIDPRRTGVRTNGAYWGGNGEQIDLLSGNLNFTLPLIRAQGRGGWGVNFALNYNSANFRKDTAATWKIGRDSGYGFGWKFLAGSITPYYADWWGIHHYVFTDSTGAEYRLNRQDANGIWYSQEGTYVRYDPVKNQLYFPDGSFWEFGAQSAGLEEDGGTFYPTKMQDTNGNYIAISYQTGAYALSPQSSARITVIEDSRALYYPYGNANQLATYWLTYTADLAPHLTSIQSISAVGVNFTFGIAQNVPLNSPFYGDNTTFGTTGRLDSVTGAYNQAHVFTYNSNSSGELTQVQFPYGGKLGWQFMDYHYSDGRVVRDMYNRLLDDTINGQQSYAFYHDAARDLSGSTHSATSILDAGQQTLKNWTFDPVSGLLQQQVDSTPSYATYRYSNLTWTADSDGNPYIGTTYNYLVTQPGGAQTIARTDQVKDNYGNLTQMKIYDYNNTSTPARTYNNYYVIDPIYTSRYMHNLLSNSTVTPAGSSPITLVSNWYDYDTIQSVLVPCAQTTNSQYQASPPDSANEFDPTYNGNGAGYRGNVCGSVNPSGIRRMQYNRAGAALQQSVNGIVTNTVPAAANNYAVPSAISTGNLTSSMTWNGAFQPTGATNPNGASSSLAYDLYARPSGGTSPYGSATGITYNNWAPGTPATRVTTTATTTTNNRWTRETLDGFGRTVKVETGYTTNNGSPTIVGQSESIYAPCGCTPMGKVKQTSATHAPGGPVYWTVYTYDPLGRTLTVSQPNNLGQTRYAYAGNTVTVTDAAGKWKTFTTDALGNLTQVTEPNPKGGDNYNTSYTYNTFNQLLNVSMTRPKVPANGTNVTQTRTFTYYQDTPYVHTATNPENGTVSYTYNGFGKVATKTDAKGQTIAYDYDSLARLVTVRQQFPNGSSTVIRSYTYDANGWNQGTYLNGRLARVDYGSPNAATGSWSELYGYHPAGGRTAKRITSNVSGAPAQNLDAFWTYNNEGRVQSVQYPDTTDAATLATIPGYVYTYNFDQMGRPSELAAGAGLGTPTYKHVQNVTYGPSGEMTGIQYVSSAVWYSTPGIWNTTYTGENRTYNARMQVTNISNGSDSISYNYFDVAQGQADDTTKNNGKVGRIVSTLGGVTEEVHYRYDSLNRLIAAYTTDTSANGWGLAWDYDGFGNRWSQTVTQGTAQPMTASYDQTTNRFAGGGYDANGNPTYGYNVSYDVENRMLTNGTDNYVYAPDNMRIYKSVLDGNGNKIEYVYFYSGSKRLATYKKVYPDPNQPAFYFAFVSANVYFGGKLVQAEGAAILADRLRTVVWDSLKGYHRYFPYGEERTTTTNESTKFGTYFRDASTGLDYAANRYFDSRGGRFLTPDQSTSSFNLMSPGSWNRYSYSSNDPISRGDPLGLFDYDPDDECTWVNGTLTCPEPEPPDTKPAGSSDGNGDGQNNSSGSSQNSGPLADATMRAEWYAGIEVAINRLKKTDCGALFGLTGGAGNSSPGALDVLAKISNSYVFGPISSKAGTVTSATTTGSGIATIPIGNGATIVVSKGVVIRVNNTSSGSSFVSGNANDWAATILHELGHAYIDLYGQGTSRIGPDGDDVSKSMANTKEVKEQCNL